MKKILLILSILLIGSSTLLFLNKCDNKKTTFQEETELKSDHIIFDEFGAWKVRHVFDQDSLSYKYSDAKIVIKLRDGREFPFQINHRSDHWVTYIMPGWIDKVIITIDDVQYEKTQSSLHTFYGEVNEDLLNAFAKTKNDIRILFFSQGEVYSGTINPDGSSAALRWIRVIK